MNIIIIIIIIIIIEPKQRHFCDSRFNVWRVSTCMFACWCICFFMFPPPFAQNNISDLDVMEGSCKLNFFLDLAFWVPIFDEDHYMDESTIGMFALCE